MSERLIPNGDTDFATKARTLGRVTVREPGRFGLTPDDAQAMLDAADRFSDALQKARHGGGRSTVATRLKDKARAEAKRLYLRCAKIIRSNEQIDAATLISAGLPVPSEKRHARTCPQEPPELHFVQALHIGNGARSMHELRFKALDANSRCKPRGAARLELFVDLIPPDEPVPAYPGANHGNRPWYLRSFSRSPIKLEPPICRVPMLVVYWGRWADATGNVGPFSKTVVARIEGASGHMWAGLIIGGKKAAPILEDASAAGPADRAQRYSVAVLDAQYECLDPQQVETRRLEGPPASDADEVSEAA